MRIYNTLTRQLDKFEPLHGNKVNAFVCGPTVYDYAHIGNAKTYTQFDFIVRYLRSRGFEVFYLQNITDIDDKIINRAKENGVSWKELAEEYEKIYLEDMAALHNTSVDKYARATDYIPQIVNQVKTLMVKGFAYKTSDGIYYNIEKFKDYGKLSGRTELKETDGISRIDSSAEKIGWNDFCLWKFSKPGEPVWDTELGKGRPGWHIEDTAITESFFGSQYDVHGAAIDLIFPHHEAEIAQMEAASGKSPLVKYWIHTGFINMRTKKMSKSLGNFKTIREVLRDHDYKTLRYLFISSHYRSSLEFSEENLEHARNALKRLDEFIFSIDPNLDDPVERTKVEGLRLTVDMELENDLNTPKALARIFEYIRESNIRGKAGKHILAYLKELNQIFDFMDFGAEQSDEEIERLITLRKDYRSRKLFNKADSIRKALEAKGVILYDIEDGVKWRRA